MRRLILKILIKFGTVTGVVVIACGVVLILYSILYWFVPFASFWSGFILAAIISLVTAYPLGSMVNSYALKLKTQSKAAKADSATKNKLINILSHDLNSPLNNIKQTLIMLESEIISREDFLGLSKSLSKEIDRTLTLTSNLIKWIQIQRRDFKPDMVKLKIGEVIEECIHLYIPISKEKGITLNYNPSTDYEFESDPEMIKIIVRNLLSNAIKYSHQNGIVEIHVLADEKTASVLVTDTGVGMSEDEVRRLLAMNTLTSQPGTNEEKGTGLGISLCKTVVGQLNGDLSAKSREGSGTTFQLDIPAPNLRRLNIQEKVIN